MVLILVSPKKISSSAPLFAASHLTFIPNERHQSMNQAARITHGNGATCAGLNPKQRWGALIAGGSLTLLGLSRRSASGLALAAAGGALVYAGARTKLPDHFEAASSLLLNFTPEEAFRLWRNFKDLPLFMYHLESVTQIGDGRYRWIAAGPFGSPLRWDAEIVDERQNELIAWRSLPDSEIEVDGYVKFRPAPAGRGTLVIARVLYRPPGGAAARAVAKMLGKDPKFMMRQDLRRFKALIETGEIPTIDGQTHGPRSFATAAMRLADPDRPIRGDAEMREILNAKRRIA